jgi:hypothetical protein
VIRGRLALVLLAVATLGLAACGGDGGEGEAKDRDPVAAAQARLAEVDRATIDVRFVAAAGDGATPGKDVGFALEGPFQLPDGDGDLPVAALTSTRLLGDREVQSRFVSTGKRAWVVTEQPAKVVELRGPQLDALRGSTGGGGADLTALHLSKWFATRKTTSTNDTVTVTGTLDAPTAIADVLALSGGLVGDAPAIEGDDADRLRALVRSSNVKLVTDRDDGTIRTLHFDVHFAPEDQPKVAEVLPELAGVDLRLDLALRDVGEDVEVEPPAGA